MSTVAVGDIHGNLLALEDLLAKVVPELEADDTLVFLGDYIDRGPDSRGCIERIVQLKQEARFAVVALLGNHEQWMLRTMGDYTRHSWILGMEAFDTIFSYSPGAAQQLSHELKKVGVQLLTEALPLPYDVFFEAMPPSHVAFFESLVPFHRTNDVVCVHGGVDPAGGPVETQQAKSVIWGVRGFSEDYQGAEKVVYGHWNDAVEDEAGWPLPNVRNNRTFGIDTIASGVLTAMRFPDLAVFQSQRF